MFRPIQLAHCLRRTGEIPVALECGDLAPFCILDNSWLKMPSTNAVRWRRLFFRPKQQSLCGRSILKRYVISIASFLLTSLSLWAQTPDTFYKLGPDSLVEEGV